MDTRNAVRAVTQIVAVFVATCVVALSSHATILVSNTWNTGVRTYPASPTYSEMGVDSNTSLDLESAWYTGGSGGFAPSAGHLVMTNGPSGSSSWTTYFTDEANPVTLANPGDLLRVRWVFTPTGVNAGNTSQNFRLAVVDTPSAARLAADGAPGSAAYTGYGMFMNMGTPTLGNANPFRLMEFVTVSSALLSASGAWVPLTNGAASGTTGYASGTTYTYTMTMTRNGLGGLDIVSTMSGGSLGGSGTITDTFTDSTPSGFIYDTFSLRPSDGATTAASFDTTLFMAEFIPIPEPSTLVLAATGLGLMVAAMRRRR